MLLSEYKKVKISRRNMPHYKEKGYLCNFGDFILAKVDDFSPSSKELVLVICEECKTIKEMKYQTYLLNINSTSIHEYYCTKCNAVKSKLIFDKKQKLGLLNRDSNYYWTYKENVLRELSKYLSEYRILDNISRVDVSLYVAMYKYYNVEDLINELGYKLEDVFVAMPYGYYDKLENIVSTNTKIYQY